MFIKEIVGMKQNKNNRKAIKMKVIGLTGGTGSGKSIVSAFLSKMVLM